jgi:hypothetical protein
MPLFSWRTVLGIYVGLEILGKSHTILAQALGLLQWLCCSGRNIARHGAEIGYVKENRLSLSQVHIRDASVAFGMLTRDYGIRPFDWFAG